VESHDLETNFAKNPGKVYELYSQFNLKSEESVKEGEKIGLRKAQSTVKKAGSETEPPASPKVYRNLDDAFADVKRGLKGT